MISVKNGVEKITISSEITNILNDLGSRLGVVIDWSSQNVVPYVQDLVSRIAKLQICNSIIAIVCGIVCLVGLILIIRFAIKHWEDYVEEVVGTFVIVIFIACLIGIFTLIPIGVDGLTQAIYLPELTAIEYIQRLMK